jgi:uncharacterized protein YbjT (DUF2867 family)
VPFIATNKADWTGKGGIMYLIVGASGMLGSAVARRLLAEGKSVRATSRDPQKLEGLARLGAEVVAADLRDPVSLARACQGAEKVLVAVHAVMGKGSNRSEAVDDQGHCVLIDAAKKAGVAHFVYASVWGAAPDHPVDFLRTKYRVEEYLRASGLSFTILRPTAFMEFHAHVMIGQPLAQKGKVTLFGRGRAKRSFVAVDDVAAYAMIALDDPAAPGKVIEIGSENFTNLEVAHLYARLLGIQPKIGHVPPGMLRLMSGLIRPFHPGLSRIMHWSYVEDSRDAAFDLSHILQDYPVRPVGLEEWARRKLAAEVAVPVKEMA